MKVDEKYVRGRVDYWRKLLAFEKRWKIIVNIIPTVEQMSEDQKSSAAFVNIESAYFQADITICLENNKNKQDLDDTIVHELIHIILDPLDKIVQETLLASGPDFSTMVTEQVVERLMSVVTNIHRKAKKCNPQKAGAKALSKVKTLSEKPSEDNNI
jgi:hypothetical protein